MVQTQKLRLAVIKEPRSQGRRKAADRCRGPCAAPYRRPGFRPRSASLAGGRGSVVGTLCGAALMSTILVGCVLLGIPTAWQKVILGMIIVVAVTIDQLRQRRLNLA